MWTSKTRPSRLPWGGSQGRYVNRTDIDTCSLTELRRSTSACIARAEASARPLFITRRGTVVAVLMTIEQYERMRGHTDELCASVRATTTSVLGTPGADEPTARLASLRGAFKGSQFDEDDYRRYLEEKYR